MCDSLRHHDRLETQNIRSDEAWRRGPHDRGEATTAGSTTIRQKSTESAPDQTARLQTHVPRGWLFWEGLDCRRMDREAANHHVIPPLTPITNSSRANPIEFDRKRWFLRSTDSLHPLYHLCTTVGSPLIPPEEIQSSDTTTSHPVGGGTAPIAIRGKKLRPRERKTAWQN